MVVVIIVIHKSNTDHTNENDISHDQGNGNSNIMIDVPFGVRNHRFDESGSIADRSSLLCLDACSI